MTKKTKNRTNEVLFNQEFFESPIISEKFPTVSLLNIKMIFCDESGNRIIESQNKEFTSTSKAFFQVKCLQRECVNGGFDISNQVASAINSRETIAKGRLNCQGWQDLERVGSFHCLWVLDYEISIQYVQN